MIVNYLVRLPFLVVVDDEATFSSAVCLTVLEFVANNDLVSYHESRTDINTSSRPNMSG